METPPTDDERSLEDLARRARRAAQAEGSRFPPYWDALAAGRLPDAEVARLRAAAVGSATVRAAFEVFRPLGAGFRAGMMEQVLALLRPSETRRPRRRSARVLAFLKAGHHRRWSGLAAAATVAAALSLYWLAPPAGRHLTPSEVLATVALPAYQLSVTGTASRRSADATVEVPSLAPGTSCTLVLRPAAPAASPVAARLYAVHGEKWRRWHVELEIAPSGALRADGPMVDDLSLDPGSWLLVAAVGRLPALPSTAELRAALESGEGAPADGGWQLVETPVKVLPPP